MSAPVLESRTPARVRSIGVSKRSRFVGFLVVMMLLGLAAAFLAPVYAGFRVVSDGNVDDRQATDAIVVLGAAQYNGKPSPVLKGPTGSCTGPLPTRCRPAHRDRGGKQPGDRFTEAGAGQDYLARRGVPAGDVAAVSVGHDASEPDRCCRDGRSGGLAQCHLGVRSRSHGTG